MPHVTGHFCVCHVELWLLFHDFFPVPGHLDLDLGTWVPGYLGIPENQLFWGTRKKLAIWSDMPENKLRNGQRYPKYPIISSDIGQLCPIFENGASLTNI